MRWAHVDSVHARFGPNENAEVRGLGDNRRSARELVSRSHGKIIPRDIRLSNIFPDRPVRADPFQVFPIP